MKKTILIISTLLMICSYAKSQDMIIMRNGDTLRVKVIKSTSDYVEYIYPNETLVNQKLKESILEIVYSSGRIEICSERIKLESINGKEDWEKVIITFDKNDILGLTVVDTIIGKSTYGAWLSVKGGKEAMKKMKKKAAEIKASIILITDGWHKEKNKPISGYGRCVKLTGIAYK